MFLKTTTAAILTAALSTGAIAQGLTGSVTQETTGSVSKGDTGIVAQSDASASLKTGKPMNYGQVISGLKNGSAAPADWAAKIGTVKADAEVEIVALSQLRGEAGANAEALDKILMESQEALAQGRDAIEANGALFSALSSQNFRADDVVAVYVSSDSQVVLVVDDRA